MFDFIRKYWFFIILAAIAFLIIAIKVTVPPRPRPTPKEVTLQQPHKIAIWQGIIPGQTSIEQLNQIIKTKGFEVKSVSESEITIESELGGPPHEVIIQGQIVGLVKQQVFGEEKLDIFIAQYGQLEGEFWGPHQEAGFKTYVFPRNGLVVIAGPEEGLVAEIWYFAPTTLERFLATWGKELTPMPQNGY